MVAMACQVLAARQAPTVSGVSQATTVPEAQPVQTVWTVYQVLQAEMAPTADQVLAAARLISTLSFLYSRTLEVQKVSLATLVAAARPVPTAIWAQLVPEAKTAALANQASTGQTVQTALTLLVHEVKRASQVETPLFQLSMLAT
jgi:uncharacterized protein with beta-barrel porin domain